MNTDDMKDFITGAEYAIAKQIESVQLLNNYGEIDLLQHEHEEMQKFLRKMMKRRIKLLKKFIKEDEENAIQATL